MKKKVFIKKGGKFYEATVSSITCLLKGMYNENVFETNLGVFSENCNRPNRILFWTKEDVAENKYCGTFDTQPCRKSFNDFCVSRGLEMWCVPCYNVVKGCWYYWGDNEPVKNEVEIPIVGFDYDFDLETWFPIGQNKKRIIPFCPKGCYMTAKECKADNKPIFIMEDEREDLRANLFCQILEKVKSNDGFVRLQNPLVVKDGGVVFIVKAVTLKYSYESCTRPYCNLVAISRKFESWDVDDYFTETDLERLIKEM